MILIGISSSYMKQRSQEPMLSLLEYKIDCLKWLIQRTYMPLL